MVVAREQVAFVTGACGQDASYLMELLLDKGYEVHGMYRRSSTPNFWRIRHLLTHPQLHLHQGDLTDGGCLHALVSKIAPMLIFNLAAQSDVATSFENPTYTAAATGLGVLNLLEAVRNAGLLNQSRFYQASSSELFGQVAETPQRETTPMHPRSPYGTAKLFAYWTVQNYRETFGAFCVNGILHNHESERRGEGFVTRKITMAVARIDQGFRDCLFLGNLEAKRDWGAASDFVEAMYLMLQHDEPQDFVIATGVTTTVRRFVEMAFEVVGLSIEWRGSGLHEVGIVEDRVVVKIASSLYRPCEVETLQGDASKAKRVLGWEPRYTLHELVHEMVKADVRRVSLKISGQTSS